MTASHRAIASLAALALFACQSPASTPTEDKPESEPEVEAPAPEPKPAPRSRPIKSNARLLPVVGSARVYLLTGESNPKLVRFDDSGAATLPTTGVLVDLFEGPDNGVYVLDASALHRLVADPAGGEQLVEVVRFPAEIAPVRHLALGPDMSEASSEASPPPEGPSRRSMSEASPPPEGPSRRSMWVVTENSIGERTGDTWKLTPLTELELPNTATLAIDSDRTVWAVAPESARYLEDGRWLAPPLSLLEPGFTLLNPVGSPVGRVHVSNQHRLTRLGKTNFDSVLIDYRNRVPHTADLDIAPDGYACMANDACDLGCANAVPPTIIWSFPGSKYACDSLQELAVEANHRVWVASPAGLSLVQPDYTVHEFSVAQHPALAGPITDMVVVE